jgi:REP element-mobilizing transposase RayT
MAGVLRDETVHVIEIGVMPDHVHLLIQARADRAVADVVRVVKSKSSLWIHQTFPDRRLFAWQAGYAVFSVSDSRSEHVRRYIRNQKEHHKRQCSLDELKGFLDRCGVQYDERYLG